ncbi:hypothetical protein E9529_12300 [Blastococcus sp. KM273128]|uniref:hypothetical protein n=1 Tax=Blastococcus sp. KM273128 TaxID=2570314 RepID=UPI001F4591DE|nr:hypothetical protein [Blastococcus sp. KM273128]MCF6745045.1 hypothetical protein [Blastococcus sp. KM273128]
MTTSTAPMQGTRTGVLRRLVPLAGAASVVAAYAGASLGDLGGAGLNPSMAPDLLAARLQEHVGSLRAGASLLSVGAVLAAVFAGPLWQRLRAASGPVAVVGAAGAVLAAAQWLAFATDGIGLATAADVGNGATAQVLLTTGWESARTAAVPSLVMVLAVVVAGFGSGCFPRWFSWFSAATLVPLLVALTAVGPSGLLGFVFGGLWLVVASVVLTRDAPAR